MFRANLAAATLSKENRELLSNKRGAIGIEVVDEKQSQQEKRPSQQIPLIPNSMFLHRPAANSLPGSANVPPTHPQQSSQDAQRSFRGRDNK